MKWRLWRLASKVLWGLLLQKIISRAQYVKAQAWVANRYLDAILEN